MSALRRTLGTAMLVAAVLTLSDCGERRRQAAREESAVSVADHMADHFKGATTIRDAVVRGNLQALRDSARWLAEHSTPQEMPGDTEPYLELMRSAATRALEATEVETAARAVASIAEACGSCHFAVGAQVRLVVDSMPAAMPGRIAHMARHKWAADRLWDGLVIPDDAEWDDGVEALGEAPLTPEDLPADMQPEIARLAARVHELVGAATTAESIGERSRVYGELLGTCAACHQSIEPNDE